MKVSWGRRLCLAATTAAVIAAGVQFPVAQAVAPAGTDTAVVLAAPAKQAAVLVVAPGRIGSLKMGTKTSKARRAGWIARGECDGWTAGRRSYRLDADGNEVYKAYPDKIKGGRVRSMHAMGVVTRTGVRTASLGEYPTPGSTLAEVQAAYPGLVALGTWRDYLTDTDWPVHTTGSRKKGWLDFYFDPGTLTVRFVQVRTNSVAWGEPEFGC